MEDYSTLKQLLESLFDEKDLKSWTVHDNQAGTVCTLRFVNVSNATRETLPAPKTATFKQKSKYQVKRDRERLESFNNRANTRSQSIEPIENVRHGDDVTVLISEPNLSPVSVTSFGANWSPSADQFHSDAESPTDNLSQMSSITVDLPDPDVSDIQQITAEQSEQTLTLRDSADGVDSGLFYEHISKRSQIQYNDIKCHDCPMYIRSVGIEAGHLRLLYCVRCDMYTCTRCRPPSETETLTHSSTCNSSVDFIT